MSVENMKWDNQGISWVFEGNKITKNIDHVFFASVNKSENCVVVEAGLNFSQDQVYHLTFDGTPIFIVDKTAGKVCWKYQDKIVEIETCNILNAQLYAEQGIVLIIIAINQKDKLLKGFALDGSLRFEKHPPEGFDFNYLTSNRNQPSVVCDGDDSNTDQYGRNSRHFIIDSQTGDLLKENLAY
ncbi:hypothetical protein [Paenibacillus xylaniclasticus]|uniref:hypothetical protein n=1 Tax=Paenibacillus xylaniclasticus TaxID=588083 RepID=UPI000FD88468|nr:MULTISPECIES: hypothetical protein [Paenibacillus]GFN30968.1 hypothetical protein PCURB6_12280 [Paenibacillus curdlanolyticus]